MSYRSVFKPDLFAGKNIIVTGGGSGIGRCTAHELAALGARRLGAGLVTIVTPPEAFAVYAAEEPGTLIKPVEDVAAFRDLLDDPRKNAVLVGPGAGLTKATAENVLAALAAGKAVVIDADGVETVGVRPLGILALAWDHRAFDGAYAAAFLQDLKRILETTDWVGRWADEADGT